MYSNAGLFESGADLLPVAVDQNGLRNDQDPTDVIQDLGSGGDDQTSPRSPILEVADFLRRQHMAKHESYVFGVEDPRVRDQSGQFPCGGRLPGAESSIQPDDHTVESIWRRPLAGISSAENH